MLLLYFSSSLAKFLQNYPHLLQNIHPSQTLIEAEKEILIKHSSEFLQQLIAQTRKTFPLSYN
jgi:hypothetical protein